MKKIKCGDIVGRKSYNKDIIFLVKDVSDKNNILLEGIFERIIADSSIDDLEIINKKDNQIADLNNQINILKNSFFDNVDDLKEQINDKDELIKAKDEIQELNKKLNKVDEERVAIFKELDYKNKMILAYNVELNKSILNAINVVIDEARDNINKRNAQLVEDLEKSISKLNMM